MQKKKLNYKQIAIYRNPRKAKGKQLDQINKLNEKYTAQNCNKKRLVIEHKFALLKSYKRLNVRYEKFAVNYELFLIMALSIDIFR